MQRHEEDNLQMACFVFARVHFTGVKLFAATEHPAELYYYSLSN